MRRQQPSEHARDRIFDDDELPAQWRAAEQRSDVVGPFVKFSLYTACRRGEAAGMRWDEIAESQWILPPARNKVGRELVRPLSEPVLKLLDELPRLGPYVFSITGQHPFAGFRGKIGSKAVSRQCDMTSIRATRCWRPWTRRNRRTGLTSCAKTSAAPTRDSGWRTKRPHVSFRARSNHWRKRSRALARPCRSSTSARPPSATTASARWNQHSQSSTSPWSRSGSISRWSSM